MTAKQFVTWMKGFTQAANTYNITPKQWDSICEHLSMVEDDTKNEYRTKGNSVTTSYGLITDTTYDKNQSSTNTIF